MCVVFSVRFFPVFFHLVSGRSTGEQLSEISQRPVLVALVGGRGIGFSFQLAIIRHQY